MKCITAISTKARQRTKKKAAKEAANSEKAAKAVDDNKAEVQSRTSAEEEPGVACRKDDIKENEEMSGNAASDAEKVLKEQAERRIATGPRFKLRNRWRSGTVMQVMKKKNPQQPRSMWKYRLLLGIGKTALIEEQDLTSDHDDCDDGGLTALTGVEAAARLARKEEEQAQARLEEAR